MPAASAMSRTVVLPKPFSANRRAAIARSSLRLFSGRDPSVVCAVTSGLLAAHGDDLAGHVGGVVAGQEDHHVGDLPRLGGATEGLALLELGEQLVGGHLG